ncbi:MAG: transposase [Bacteroidia bacterium]|nr:transposase [Bacteroidia bacterium]
MSDKFQDRYRIPSARASWWDYGRNAAYFVTICILDRECYFGEIVEKQFIASPIGEIAQTYWQEIPQHFPYVQLDSFVIMPNHLHGIIIIDKPEKMVGDNETESKIDDGMIKKTIENSINDHVETLHATSLQQAHATSLQKNPATEINPSSQNINSEPINHSSPFKNEHMASISPKSGTLGSIIRSYKSAVSKKAHLIKPGFEWQERFHDSIILNERSYQIISDYIINNPANWKDDNLYSERKIIETKPNIK